MISKLREFQRKKQKQKQKNEKPTNGQADTRTDGQEAQTQDNSFPELTDGINPQPSIFSHFPPTLCWQRVFLEVGTFGCLGVKKEGERKSSRVPRWWVLARAVTSCGHKLNHGNLLSHTPAPHPESESESEPFRTLDVRHRASGVGDWLSLNLAFKSHRRARA